MRTPTLKLTAGAAVAAAAIAAAGALAPLGRASATTSHTVRISAKLTVTHTAPPVCTNGVCLVRNHGHGTLTPYGAVTFTTVVTADTNQPPCGTGSQWVNRIIRTITTSQGTLVLHEAGLLCPQSATVGQVKAVWAADGTDSTGTFAAVTGHGSDTAYPAQNTAAPHGTLTLTP